MEALQVTWFILIGVLLIGHAVLDGFDFGVGFWHLFAKNSQQRQVLLKAIGPFWDGNEVWLLTGGGALFAAFPAAYASVFSGMYLAMMLVLMGLIFRAVAIEVRNKESSARWQLFWDRVFAISSIVPALLFGVALGNLVRGVPLDASGNYMGTFFQLLNPYSLFVGITGLAMFALHGAIFIAMKTSYELEILAIEWAKKIWVFLLLLFVAISIISSVNYLRNSHLLPILCGFLSLLLMLVTRIFLHKLQLVRAFFASSGIIAVSLLAVATTLFPYLVPASNNPSSSLTISNSSSSQLTLTTMLIIAVIGMPLVLAYTIYVYRIFRGKIN